MNNNILWLDTETTGLDPNKHFVFQLSYISIFNNEIKFDNDILMRPQYIDNFLFSQDALNTNKKTIEEIKSYKSEEEQIKIFLRDLQSSQYKFYIAGYNVKFDIEFLKALFSRQKINITDHFNYIFLDVMQLVVNLKLSGKINPLNCKLQTVLQYFDLIKDVNSLHNAKQDVLCTKLLYDFLISKFNI